MKNLSFLIWQHLYYMYSVAKILFISMAKRNYTGTRAARFFFTVAIEELFEIIILQPLTIVLQVCLCIYYSTRKEIREKWFLLSNKILKGKKYFLQYSLKKYLF